MDLLAEQLVTGVITQGRELTGDLTCSGGGVGCDQWITEYKVAYGSDGVTWRFIADSAPSAARVGLLSRLDACLLMNRSCIVFINLNSPYFSVIKYFSDL